MGGEDHGHQARQGGETKQGGRHCGGTRSIAVEISELRNFQEKKGRFTGLFAFAGKFQARWRSCCASSLNCCSAAHLASSRLVSCERLRISGEPILWITV